MGQEKAKVKGVDQDDGLKKMLDSEDSDSDEDKKDKEDEEKSDEEKDKEGKKKKKSGNSEKGNSSDEEGGKQKKKSRSRSTTPTKDTEKADKAEKRKAMVANLLDPNAGDPSNKKSRLDQFGSSSSAMTTTGNEAISEEAVRRYLNRRPMTTTD